LIAKDDGSCLQSTPIYLTLIWSFFITGFLKDVHEKAGSAENDLRYVNPGLDRLFLLPMEGEGIKSNVLHTTASVTKMQRNKPALLSIYKLVAQN